MVMSNDPMFQERWIFAIGTPQDQYGDLNTPGVIRTLSYYS